MDRFCGEICGKEDPASCYPLFPAISYDGQDGDGGRAGIPACGNGGEVSGICVCGELLSRIGRMDNDDETIEINDKPWRTTVFYFIIKKLYVKLVKLYDRNLILLFL